MPSPPDPPGVAARRAALRLLDAVLRRGEPLDRNAPNVLRALPGPEDRALATAIASEALRWLTDLDALIDSATRTALPADAKPRSVLRLMLAQALRLGTPAHAVVATGLALLGGGPRRLAHGVFSTLLARRAELPGQPSLPPDVGARWGADALRISAGLGEPPPLDLTLKRGVAPWPETGGAVSLMPGHARLPRGTPVAELPGYDAGDWWVQDLAASLPARLLAPQPGEAILDLCAAPGGKTLQLAAAGAAVTSLDISEKRLAILRRNLSRTGLSAEIVHADALSWETDERFDAILLDAPCTATGTARRHPDVLHRIGERQIAEMAELQARLIDRAARWLRPGGRLVYAVCSLERAEGEAQASRVPLRPDPIRPDELPEWLSPTAEGWLRTDPGMLAEHGGLDGFFIARFVN